MEDKKILEKEDLENMTPKEIAEYKIALNELSLEIDDLITQCDEILNIK